MKWFRQPPARARCWLFCDGSTGGRAGPLATAYAAAAAAHDDDGQLLDWAWQRLAPLTNNEAEYAGLLLALSLAQRQRAHEVHIIMDSEVVVGQMQGRFAVHSPALRRWHWQACTAARTLPVVQYHQVPREWNRLADGLAAQATLDWDHIRSTLLNSHQSPK
jgi:ribonuclease HI